jgi:hypothetical protein
MRRSPWLEAANVLGGVVLVLLLLGPDLLLLALALGLLSTGLFARR